MRARNKENTSSYRECSRGYLHSSTEQQGHGSQGANWNTEEGKKAKVN